jgi:outer membrane biosynthesis protein TonB
LALAVLAGFGAASCAKVQARVPAPPPPPPPLVVPAAPDPLIVPVAIAERLPVPSPEPTPATSKPAPPTRSSERPPPVATPTPTPTPDPPPPAALQTTANVAEIEARTNELIGAARRDLDRVSYRNLPKDAREQYDTAARMMNTAKIALANKDYLRARSLAEKAASIASLLIKGLESITTRPTGS